MVDVRVVVRLALATWALKRRYDTGAQAAIIALRLLASILSNGLFFCRTGGHYRAQTARRLRARRRGCCRRCTLLDDLEQYRVSATVQHYSALGTTRRFGIASTRNCSRGDDPRAFLLPAV